MTEARSTKWLNRTIVAIALASLFSDAGHEMATSAMPMLLASMGASSAIVGVIEGFSDGVASFAKLYSGLYSDRLARRKPLAVVGYFMTAAGMASFAYATAAWHVLVGRIGGWLGRGVRSPVRKVLLAEATTKESHGRAFGFDRAMDSLGAVIGPLLAIPILDRFGVRPLFLFTLIPGLLAAAMIVFFVQEKPHVARPKASLLAGARGLPERFKRFLFGVGVAGLGDYSNTLLILWATQAFMPTLGARAAAVRAMELYVLYNLVFASTCYAAGWLADRVSKRALLAGGYAFAVVPAIALLVPGASLVKFALVFAASGLYMGVWETVESATAAEYLPSESRGVGFGVLDTVNGVGDVLSSIVVGALWAFSSHAAMGFVIATSLAGAAVIASSPAKADA